MSKKTDKNLLNENILSDDDLEQVIGGSVQYRKNYNQTGKSNAQTSVRGRMQADSNARAAAEADDWLF